MDLNEGQQEAVRHVNGPMLVLAGPGSGKTTVITKRTRRLVEECGVKPDRILVITFTKAAATEMKERFLRESGKTGKGVVFGTFHAVFFRILKYAYRLDASKIIREEDKYQFFRELIAKMELDIEDEKDFVEGLISEISLVKGERMDVNNYYSMNCPEENFRKIYTSYENMLRNSGRLDFDDMLLMTYELLTARKDILTAWQEQYEYILIDEFQDINRVQYDIVRLLSKPQDNLFIVGDDDQSIYRFRGAKPEIMLNFEKDYPQAKRVLLNVNYRSAESIVKAAGRLIAHNQKRFPKEIQTVHPEKSGISCRKYPDVKTQNEALVKELLEYKNSGGEYRNVAVLYRTNTQPGALVEKLMEYNIPFQMRDAVPNVYEHWIAKNIIAYIRIAMGEHRRELYFQIMNRPKRYLSRQAFSEEAVDLQTVKERYIREEKEYVVERIEKLQYDLKLLQKTNPYAAINYIRRAIGYDDYLREYAALRRLKEEELFDILAQLQENAREFPDFASWFAHMEQYKEELKNRYHRAEQNTTKTSPEFAEPEDAVNLMTYHASKGLEFDRVYLIDVNEGMVPHRKATLTEDLEEERRMFYVAVTRARKELVLSYVEERYCKSQQVSRFVGELMTDLKLSHKLP